MSHTVIVDAHGGDKAPREIIKGCVRAVKEYGANIILVGREAEIRDIAEQEKLSLAGITVYPTDDVISMEDDPVSIVRAHKNCSMAVGMRLLNEEEGDAFVSAGSTGALIVGAQLIIKNIHGIKRAALATVLPCEGGSYMLMDSGANAECKPEFLRDFAVMGSAYMSGIMNVPNPRVGLLSNGTEEHKGTDLTREAKPLIQESGVNFVGYVEGRDASLGKVDVLVTDGFSGNIYLKTIEGLGKMISNGMKRSFKKNPVRLLGAAIAAGALKEIKTQFDYKAYGGAPLLGIRKPVIKAHGTADERVIANTVRQAMQYLDGDVNGRIERALTEKGN